jgi:hypothetical protein
MTREDFKKFAAGNFILINLTGTIQKDLLNSYMEGAVFAFDFLTKTKQENKTEQKEITEEKLKELVLRDEREAGL